MQPIGRPHALDEDRCAEICDLVTAGHPLNAVARLVGCNVKTIRRHAERDERFARMLGTAEIAARHDPIKMMRRAAGSSWRAAAWILERTEPERYGKQPPATCRPEDLDRTFTRIMDTALGQIQGDAQRRAMYQSLAKVMEEESVSLFLPPSVRRATQKQDHTFHVDEQRMQDLFDSLRPVSEASRTSTSPPQARGSVPRPQTPSPKTPASKTDSNPAKNSSPRH